MKFWHGASGDRAARAGLSALAALLLAGCSGKEIPDSWLSIIENEAAAAPAPSAECETRGDPKWTPPPEGDELAALSRRAINDPDGR